MKVFAVGGKAFFHKDDLKALGFRWYREPKLWVKPESQAEYDAGLDARLNGMNGIRWEILDLPVEGMFSRSPRPAPQAAPMPAPKQAAPIAEQAPAVSSLDRARMAAAKLASAPAQAWTDQQAGALRAAAGTRDHDRTNLAVAAESAQEPKEELDYTPELTRLRGRIAAIKMMLVELEQDAAALAARVEC